MQRLNAVLAIVVTRRICSRLRLKRLRIPSTNDLINAAFRRLRIKIVNYLTRRSRIRQILLAIHPSRKSSHTNSPTGLAPASFHLYMTKSEFRYGEVCFERFDYCGSVDELPVVHDVPDASGVSNI